MEARINTLTSGDDATSAPRRWTPGGLHAEADRSLVDAPTAAAVLVGPELVAAEAALHELLGSNIPVVSEIGRYLAASGGKRMRPLLTALGARASGHDGPIAELMCAGELIHLGSLLHDDVVDHGQDRRGLPAAWRVYGNAGVILTGDFCVAKAIEITAEQAGLPAVTALAATIAAMSEAEVLQLQNTGDLNLELSNYLHVIEQKSASLIAWCAAAGAWVARRPEHVDALLAYGRGVGVAFQVVDDVLDYVGEKRLTGKRRGQDLAELKPTLPLLLALDRVPGLREQLEKGPPSPERIPRLLEQVRASGATDAAMDRARAYANAGIEALGALPDTPARAALAGLGHALVERTA